MNQNETDLNEGYSNEATAQALRSLKKQELETSPYFKARLLAHVKDQAQVKQSFFKKYLVYSVLSTCALLVVTLTSLNNINLENHSPVASHSIGETYVIRMDIRPLKEVQIEYAEIILPDEKIEFASKTNTEVSQQRKLIVSWDLMVQKQFLPIIVKGLKAGSSSVVVNFYDSSHNLVKSQTMNLHFKGG